MKFNSQFNESLNIFQRRKKYSKKKILTTEGVTKPFKFGRKSLSLQLTKNWYLNFLTKIHLTLLSYRNK